jgi:hypothetical protein
MAGTLTISTLSDGTNSTSSTNCIQGSNKAWCNWAGSTGTIRTSYNVSSVTRNGTGDWTVNFTNAFADANYCVTNAISLGTTYAFPTFNLYAVAGATSTTAPTASSFRCKVGVTGAVNGFDPDYVCLMVNR